MNPLADNYLVIMAGGIGSRFWPASREARPKQFLDILGQGRSLLQATYDRFSPTVSASNVFVITHEQYRQQVKEQLPALDDSQIVGEPSRNNTAPCIAYAAFKLAALNPRANLIVAPSDHHIQDEGAFLRLVDQALQFTRQHPLILTMGITPVRPDTGYGYIELDGGPNSEGIYTVRRFTEKPNLETARYFIDTGRYCWNSGMFFFRASTILEEFQLLAPDIFNLLSADASVYNTPAESAFISERYPKTRATSLDYAIMEKSRQIRCLPGSFGWSDLGTWASLYDFKSSAAGEHVVINARYRPHVDDRGNIVLSDTDQVIVTKGISNSIVICSHDAVLIYPRSDEQEIKSLVQQLPQKYS